MVGLTLDARGFARLEDVVRVPDLASFAYTAEELQYYAREDCVGRLEVSGDGECIRATFGHAAALGVAITHPPLPRGVHVVAEVARAKWPRVRVKGLFSKSKELLMLYTGDLLRRLATFDQRRHRDGFLVYVDVQRARQDGIEFFVTSAGAVLTTGDRGRLPPAYFVRVIDSKSGADVTAEMPASAELRPQASSGSRIHVALPGAAAAVAPAASRAAAPAAAGAAGNGSSTASASAPHGSSGTGQASPIVERGESRAAARAPRAATPQASPGAAAPDVATPTPVATLTRRECELLIAAADTLRLGGGPALPLDDDGFVSVALLCERAPMRAYALDRVLQVFALDPLGRVDVHGAGGQALCRATFGQSTSVGVGDLQRARSAHVITAPRYLPSALMLPVSQRQWEHTVRNSGLLFRERRSVGLLPPALVQALRDSGELPLYDYVIVVDAKALLQSGAVLWRLPPAVDKGVVLTDGFDAFLPCDYFAKVVRVADEQVLPRTAFAVAAPTANAVALASAVASDVASSPASRRSSVASTDAHDRAPASIAPAFGRRDSAQSRARDALRDAAASPSAAERSPVGVDGATASATPAQLLGSRRDSVLSGLASDAMSPGASRALAQRAAAVFVPSVPRSPTMRIAVLPTPAGGQTPLSPAGGASRDVFQRGMSVLSLGDGDAAPGDTAARAANGTGPVPTSAPPPASSPLGKPRGGMSQFVSEAQQHRAPGTSSSAAPPSDAQRAGATDTGDALREHLVSTMMVRDASAKDAGAPRSRPAAAAARTSTPVGSVRTAASGETATVRGGGSRGGEARAPPPDAAALPTTALGRATPAVRDRDNDELARLLRASPASDSDAGAVAAWVVVDAALADGKRVLLVSPPATCKSELASIVNRRFGTSTAQLVDLDDLIDLGQMFHVSARHMAVLASDASNLVACANADTRNRFFIGYLPDAELYRRLRNFVVVALDIAANNEAAAERACVDRKFDPTDRAFHPGLRAEYEAMRGDARALVDRLVTDGVAACRVPLSEALLRRVFPLAFRSDA